MLENDGRKILVSGKKFVDKFVKEGKNAIINVLL